MERTIGVIKLGSEFGVTAGTLTVVERGYADRNRGIVLLDEVGGPYAKLSVNLPPAAQRLSADEFFFKTHGENERLRRPAKDEKHTPPCNKEPSPFLNVRTL